MKIAIVGYGKMGQMIDRLATERGIEVALKLDEHNNANYAGITAENFHGIDAAIEFSTPSTVVGNIERIAALGVNLVIGATGWHEQLDHIKALVTKHNIGLVWSPNYSVGVNAFFRIVETASRLLPDYEAWAWEIHHSAKKDAPSGTLIKLVEKMGARHVDTASSRAGVIPGTHEIGFDSPADTITVRHTARNREGFALGALKAAQWVAGKKGFHEFGDIIFGPAK
jgi:4-hydroxy-tetrahydrodipicolinate reductase